MQDPSPLIVKYRPRRLADLVGNPRIVSALQSLAARPRPCALLLSGETGIGKTSAALALAADVGCADVNPPEWGGTWIIASGDQDAAAVREMRRTMANRPWYGSGWKVFILNEADKMNPTCEALWLDILESLPAKTIVVFTTNEPKKLSARFRDRCAHHHFEAAAADLAKPAAELLLRTIRAELPAADLAAWVAPVRWIIGECTEIADGTKTATISLRRALQRLQTYMDETAAPASAVDAVPSL